MRTCSLWLAFLLTGCTLQCGMSSASSTTPKENPSAAVRDYGWDCRFLEIEGMPCLLCREDTQNGFMKVHRGGVSCDWSRRQAPAEE